MLNVRRFFPSVLQLICVAVFINATPASAREVVAFSAPPGTIVVKTGERRLYYVYDDGRAIRYPVGVGRKGMQWQGETVISGKYVQPAWSPPEDIRRDKPTLPSVIPGGSPSNPMGAAAMTLSGGDQAGCTYFPLMTVSPCHCIPFLPTPTG